MFLLFKIHVNKSDSLASSSCVSCELQQCCRIPKSIFKRSIYLLFKVFFTPGFISRTLKSGAEPRSFTSPNGPTCACMRARGKIDERCSDPPCVGCSKDIYDNIAFFSLRQMRRHSSIQTPACKKQER